MMGKIVIIDYGVGNLRSLIKAVQKFTSKTVVTDEAEVVNDASALILPGVGAFAAGMEGLKIRGLLEPVKNFAKAGKPILGICLGAQILLSRGYEFGDFEGLDLIAGKVVHFPELQNHEKIPEVGWNQISEAHPGGWRGTILEEIPPGASVYFVHSYIPVPEHEKHVLAKSRYGGYEFCSAIKHENITGTQFHPEKSGSIGLAIIKNFINSL